MHAQILWHVSLILDFHHYDELIAASKDIYDESAAGGFQKKKDVNEKQSILKSPEKTNKEVSKKDSS